MSDSPLDPTPPRPRDSEASFKSNVALTVQSAETQSPPRETTQRKGLNFWLTFFAICVCLFLSAMEFTGVSTALPTIVNDLDGDDFVWVGSAYALASTAFLPATGCMAEVFGRQQATLMSLSLFALGSALCGSAKNMNWLIAARVIQGAGGGGLLGLSSIIISDLVPLRERAMYNSVIGVTWGLASAIGPLVGGALAEEGQWRWLFYLNLPITGFAAALVVVFMKLRTPTGTLREKLARMDWIGNFLIIASSSSCVIALTWGGVRFPWTSAHVLAPLVIGVAGLCIFVAYEALYAKNPLLPFTLVSNRTSLSGFIQIFIGAVVTITVIYFWPVYFQACRNASPIRSGVDLLPIAVAVGPVLLLTGASIAITRTYRVQLWLAWCFMIAAMGGMSTMNVDTPFAHAIGIPILIGVGSGIFYSAAYYPVLAPLPVSENAHALAFFTFCRTFAGVWGVAIGTAILQTQLTHRLPPSFVQTFPGGVSIAYSVIPDIEGLSEPFRTQVRSAFAESVKVIWQVMIGISGIGFLASLLMKGLPLHTQVDERWGLEGEAGGRDGTAAASAGEGSKEDVEMQTTELLPNS